MLHKDGSYKWILAAVRLRDETENHIAWQARTPTSPKGKQTTKYTRIPIASRTNDDGCDMAWWEMDVASGNVIFMQRKTDMLGYEPDAFKHSTDFTAILHPDDYETAMIAMRNLLSARPTNMTPFTAFKPVVAITNGSTT
jgi:hypothetical protein